MDALNFIQTGRTSWKHRGNGNTTFSILFPREISPFEKWTKQKLMILMKMESSQEPNYQFTAAKKTTKNIHNLPLGVDELDEVKQIQ